jgi:DNA-binding SARP family transcriptional activator
LRIQLLGRFEVWRGSTPIPAAEWRGQKTRDLLKILLLGRGHYLAKDQLIEWLWPGADPQAAENNLRSAVSDLRRLLEPDLARGRASAFIATRRDGYCFNLDAGDWVDVLEFERAVRSSSRAEWEATLQAYPGDLLEEDPYAEWASAERARLRGLRLDLLGRVAEAALAEADWSPALNAAEQGLALDPSRETLWRALMRAHLLHGDRAAALAAFDRCRAALARDLGTDPLPETNALHQQILRGNGLAGAAPAAPAMPPTWLRQLASAGIAIWVVVTAAALALSLLGLAQGTLVSPGDPGSDALPHLLADPAARRALSGQWYLFLPIGILLLPAYLAWFGCLRLAAQQARRPAAALNWIGLVLGGLDVATQIASRSVTVVQVTVLPAAYVAAALDQRAALAVVWDILRQLAALFGSASALAGPVAVVCLSATTLAVARTRPMLRAAHPLAWAGLSLSGLGLAYTFVAPPDAASWWLALGVGLAAATYAWWLGLAGALWP